MGFSRADNPFSSTYHGVNPYAVFAKHEVLHMFGPMVCNVTITSAHSDLHGLNHKYDTNPKEI